MTLVSVTAYHSFGGEVQASNTPTIRRLTPSCRHQLPRIAPINTSYIKLKSSLSSRFQACCCEFSNPCPDVDTVSPHLRTDLVRILRTSADSKGKSQGLY